jgi:hydrogenase maturation protein HypF
LKTWHIHITGLVQGVGFRPFVYLLAHSLQLKGWVNNTSDGVHIEFNADHHQALAFKNSIQEQAPHLSIITSINMQEALPQSFTKFEIVHSTALEKADLLISPDFALCDSCREEIKASQNRRYNYAFTTCTYCGPRYSIIEYLPYDRPGTTMAPYAQCPDCNFEYNNPEDRRYFSQTNSCHSCGVSMRLHTSNGALLSASQSEIVDLAIEAWRAGKIVAIKGIGGYLLTCDARNEAAITELRKRKQRPSKPFALMCPGRESLSDIVRCTDEDWAALSGVVAPIVLLPITEEGYHKLATHAIAPRLKKLGVMLPYTPLYEMLLKAYGKTIIATSGNISQSPIVYQDEQSVESLGTVADLILSNDRVILTPQDDSVLRFSPFYHQKIVLRRSRGMAPTYLTKGLSLPEKSILAMGGMLKSTFSLLHAQRLYISQYLGNVMYYDTQIHYWQTLEHLQQVLGAKPEVILTDQHEEYPSTAMGRKIAKEQKIPMIMVQHHLAHFSAILGEHHLLDTKATILGVIWDGTGLGLDHQIWGGEFFTYSQYQFERFTHFRYFDHLLGDKMAEEPRISALSVCKGMPDGLSLLQEKFTTVEWNVYQKLLGKEQKLKTSSVGRLFDAAAAVLGVCDKQTYEGEAAILLEQLALSYFERTGLDIPANYLHPGAWTTPVDARNIFEQLISAMKQGAAVDQLAAEFHLFLVATIKSIAQKRGVKYIACSGGVFQNALLVDLMIHHLGGSYTLYFHQQLSPNDENIAFGQQMWYHISQLKAKKEHNALINQ